MVNENICPVCGFDMEVRPEDYNICPSCGTEFGVHDVNASISALRDVWIDSGPKWWSTVDPQPENWNPVEQMEAAGISVRKPSKKVFAVSYESPAVHTGSSATVLALAPNWAGSAAPASQLFGKPREVESR